MNDTKSNITPAVVSAPNSAGNTNNSIIVNESRMLQISEKIKHACLNKQLDKVTRIFSLVKPYSFTDTQNSLLKFDLFSLDSSVIEQLENFLNMPSSNSSPSSSSSSLSTLTSPALPSSVSTVTSPLSSLTVNNNNINNNNNKAKLNSSSISNPLPRKSSQTPLHSKNNLNQLKQ